MAAATKKSVRIADPQEDHEEEAHKGEEAGKPCRKVKIVLVAVDESQESVRALRFALDTVVQPGDRLVLLHSQALPQSYVGPGGPDIGSVGFYVTPDLVAATKKHQEHVSSMVLEKARKICEEANVKAELVISTGDPRDSICEAVEKTHSDLLVMGSRGHGAIKRTFLGSVSDYCVHNAKCPVLIVRK